MQSKLEVQVRFTFGLLTQGCHICGRSKGKSSKKKAAAELQDGKGRSERLEEPDAEVQSKREHP